MQEADSNHQGINHKYEVLKRSLEQYPGEHSAEEILCRFGGYEMVMAVGAMLKAAELGMVILIDGFIMTNCILAASRPLSGSDELRHIRSSGRRERT